MADDEQLNKESKGIYILVLKVRRPCRIKAGKLPIREYLPGIYFYIGRAKRHLKGRLARHLRAEKKLYWHIDYLLEKAQIREIWYRPGFFDECQIMSAILKLDGERCSPILGFGASDCRCSGHLVHFSGENSFLNSIRQKINCKEVNIDDIESIPS